MHLISSYPIQEEACAGYCGKPVLGMTLHGDTVVGIFDGIRDGYAHFKPLTGVSEAQIQNAKKKISRTLPKSGKKRPAPKGAGVRAFGLGYGGFGYGGFGYGGFGYGLRAGLGAGLGFAIPLFLLASLFTFPYFI